MRTRYVKLTIYDNNYIGYYAGISELEIYAYNKGKLPLSEDMVSVDSTHMDYEKSRIVDGRTDLAWNNNNTSPSWVIVDLQKIYDVEKVRFFGRGTVQYQSPYIFDISISNDGVNWEIVKEEYKTNTDWIWYELTLPREYITKYLVKTSNKIHILSKDKDSLVYPNLTEPLLQADYEKWGMDTLAGYENGINKVAIEMDESGVLEDGRVLRKVINKNEFKINRLVMRSGHPTSMLGQLDDIQIYDDDINPIPKFSLIKSSNKIQVLSDGIWVDTGLVEPLTKLDFETHGMDDLGTIPSEKWDELDDEFEVITWTDDMDLDQFIEITTDAFVPIEKISESDFEVLMWTDHMELEEPPKIEVTVPPFRPIDKLDNQFSIVMGEFELE